MDKSSLARFVVGVVLRWTLVVIAGHDQAGGRRKHVQRLLIRIDGFGFGRVAHARVFPKPFAGKRCAPYGDCGRSAV